MKTRLCILCAVLAPGVLGAQAPALIPMPREVVRIDAPSPLRGPVTIVPGAAAADRDAAADFVSRLAERGVEVRTGNATDGWRVELLRVGSPAAGRELAAARLHFSTAMNDEGYVLVVDSVGARVIGASDAGVFYGLQTLVQLVDRDHRGLVIRPATIRDWPAMRWRGVHDDLSRGPIPTLEYQKRQIRTAAAYKINVWSPYYEHTLEYLSHPLIAPPGGAMTQADVRELVTYAQRYHVTMVPEQEAFGHLHHVLKHERYSGLAETPHGHVLAPGDTGSLPFIRDIFSEIHALFPGPFIHLGADETFELGRGRTKALIDSVGIGPVYLGFLSSIEKALRPITDKRFLFWGDVAGNHPELVKSLPKDMIAVHWDYWSRTGFTRSLNRFKEAGLETWAAPGVNNWLRIWPNFGTALANIQGFAREAQLTGSTGLLNTTWDDDGDAIFDEVWYGVLFGAAASWQSGETPLEPFQNAFGRAFHGDTTGAIDAAQRSLIAAHAALQGGRLGDATAQLFFLDPWSEEGAQTLIRARPVLPRVRQHAESALVFIAQARRQTHLRERSALDAMELGARRIDWLAAKFQFADAIAQSFVRAAADTAQAWNNLRDLSGINGILQDMRDGYALTRDLFEQAWRAENRPYWMTNALARFDAEIIRWVDRTARMDQLNRRWSRDRIRPKPEELGIPAALLVPIAQ